MATMITFTKIVDFSTPIPGGTSTFSRLHIPSLDGNDVVFSGGSGVWHGIYRCRGGLLEAVADFNTPVPGETGNFNQFDLGQYPSIDNGKVAFVGKNTDLSEVQGIYTDIEGTLEVVADYNSPIPGGTGNFTDIGKRNWSFSIDDGNVSFVGHGSNTQAGIYTNRGDSLDVFVDTNTAIPGSSGNFADFFHLSMDDDNIAFYGLAGDDKRGLYTDLGGSLRVVADSNTPVPGGDGNFGTYGFGPPLLDGGNMAFRGWDNHEKRGIYIDQGGILDVVVDTNTPVPNGTGYFQGFWSASLDGDNIAFQAKSEDPDAIYTNIGGSITKVIGVGDTVDGKQINGLHMSGESLSGNYLAFRARVDGSEAIYVAAVDTNSFPGPSPPTCDPIPEPTTMYLVGFGILGLLGFGIRQRRKGK